MQHVPPRHWLNFKGLYDVESHNTEIFIAIAVKTSNPTFSHYFIDSDTLHCKKPSSSLATVSTLAHASAPNSTVVLLIGISERRNRFPGLFNNTSYPFEILMGIC
jgi:hypothetical protein